MPLQDDFNDAADEWFALEVVSFPKVPRSASAELVAVRALVALPVLESQGFRDHEEDVEAALLILSQSKTARRLAETAIAAGYSLMIDPPALRDNAEASEADTFGNTDHANRRINLRSGDPFHMALTIAHELSHVSQIVDGGLDVHVSAAHPLSSIRQLMMMEGDARAYEFLVAAELSCRAKDDPDERLIFPQMLDVAADAIGVPFAAKVIAAAKPELEQGGDAALWMARIFKCLYASLPLRRHYETTIVETMERLEREEPGTIIQPELFKGGMTAEDIAARLDSRGPAYLAPAMKSGYLDFNDPRMMSIAEETQQRLLALEQLRQANPATSGDAPWQGVVHRPAPPPQQPPPAPQL
jgi:hypothetical protein